MASTFESHWIVCSNIELSNIGRWLKKNSSSKTCQLRCMKIRTILKKSFNPLCIVRRRTYSAKALRGYDIAKIPFAYRQWFCTAVHLLLGRAAGTGEGPGIPLLWHTQILPLIEAKISTLNFLLYYYCPPQFFWPSTVPGSYYLAQNHPLLFLAQLVRMFWFNLVSLSF